MVMTAGRKFNRGRRTKVLKSDRLDSRSRLSLPTACLLRTGRSEISSARGSQGVCVWVAERTQRGGVGAAPGAVPGPYRLPGRPHFLVRSARCTFDSFVPFSLSVDVS